MNKPAATTGASATGADQLRECQADLFEMRAPVPGPADPGGKVQSFTVPAFLVDLGTEAVAKFGPEVLAFLERAAVAGFAALAHRMHPA